MNKLINRTIQTLAASVLIALAAIGATVANAGEVTVTWQEPGKYTDIRAGEQNKEQFEAALFKNFDGIFAELAKKLPDGVHWQVTVTDLDLAGDVMPIGTSGREMRIVKQNDRPAISFTSKLLDADNKVINEAQVELKDPNFFSRSAAIIGKDRKTYPYEEFMINQWFERQQNSLVFPKK